MVGCTPRLNVQVPTRNCPASSTNNHCPAQMGYGEWLAPAVW